MGGECCLWQFILWNFVQICRNFVMRGDCNAINHDFLENILWKITVISDTFT